MWCCMVMIVSLKGVVWGRGVMCSGISGRLRACVVMMLERWERLCWCRRREARCSSVRSRRRGAEIGIDWEAGDAHVGGLLT